MNSEMTIGFIGCGNMATAIINGLINNNFVTGKQILVYDSYSGASDILKEKFDVDVSTSADMVAKSCDILILAVKPNVIGSVLKNIRSTIKDYMPLVISIAAGKTIEFLESSADCKNMSLVRVMPNINAKVGEAMSAYCCNSNVDEEEKENVENMLSCFGKFIQLDESYFPIFGVLGGCAPAYAYMFIDSLARAAVKNGMKKEDALKIAAQTVYGSAKMILESDEHPWTLIDNVCSPGGTTIEGVTSLQADGFENAVHNAVDKALDKDKRL